IWVQDAHQPGHMHYQIFDDNYAEDVPNMGEGMTLLGDWATMIPQAIEDGYVVKADTLEELAQAIDVPVDNFVATVARYNELAEGNYDYEPDFGKLGYKVKKIAKAPFYAAPRIAYVMNTLGGLEIDGNMQVLDAEFKPIPGLFAAGNNSGCFFGGIYQDMSVPGMSVGRALLTGRVAAWRALGLVGAGEQA
ncbi:MAG: FAD-binding protein, partial [Coriobacteriales bacterium]|nr:FAD-binding protein [Coriobacteriales bacterium]